MLAGQRAAVARDQAGGVLHERPVPRAPPVGLAAGGEGEVDAHVQAAVAEVPVRHPLQPVAVEQLLEPAHVRAELLHRDGGVLPAGVRRPPVGRAVGQPGAVLADAPDGRGVRRVGDHHRVDGAGVGEHAARLALDLGDVVTGQLDDQPAGAARQVRDDGGGHVAQSLHDPLVEALDRRGLVGEQPGGGVGGLGHRGVAEHHESAHGGVGDQPDRRAQHQPEGPLAAHERAGDVEAALGQQVLQRVARHLPAEAAELGADRAERAGHQAVQVGQGARVGRRPGAQLQPGAAAGDHVQADDVVRRAPVAQGPRAAGVVADHPADRAAVVGARVGPEAQAVRAGGGLQRGLHQARFHHRRPCLGVDGPDPVQVAAGVQHHAGPDGVARDGRAGAAGGQRDAQLAADGERGEHLVDVAGAHHGAGVDAVERGVGGVQRAGQPGVVDVLDPRPAERGGELGTGAVPRAQLSGGGGGHGPESPSPPEPTCRRAAVGSTAALHRARDQSEVGGSSLPASSSSSASSLVLCTAPSACSGGP